jgi:cytochrome bd-type quinol oxidase subunit 1
VPLLAAGIHPVVAYNVLLLSSFVLSGLAMFALAASLTGSRRAAFIAALLFGFYPYRFQHYSHLELQMTYWMPLALLACHRFLATQRTRYAVAASLCTVGQLYSSMYYGVFFALYMIPVLGTLLLLTRLPLRRMWLGAAAAGLTAVATMVTRCLRLGLRNVDGLITALALPVMLMLIFVYLFNPTTGPINTFLVNVLHLFTYRTAPQWSGNSPLTLPAIAIMEVWWGLGYHTIFFIAGLAASMLTLLPLWILMFLLPFPYIANTAGWITAEVGRQPWLIYGLMRTQDGYSTNVSAGNALFTLIGFMGMYTVLGILFLFLVRRELEHGPSPRDGHAAGTVPPAPAGA